MSINTRKKLVVALSSFLLSLLLLALNTRKDSIKRFETLRTLNIAGEFREDFDKICDEVSGDFTKHLNDENYRYKESSKRNELVEIIDEQKVTKENIENYSKKLVPYLIAIVFGVISIFLWVWYCCFLCCCKNCCCCCSVKKKGNCCDYVGFIGSILFFGCTIVLCVSALSVSKKFIYGVNGSFCGIFNFYETIIEGENKTSTPKWSGVSKIIEMLDRISLEGIDPISNKGNEISMAKKETLSFYNFEKDNCTFEDNDLNNFCNFVKAEYDDFAEIEDEIDLITSNAPSLRGTLNDAKKQVRDVEDSLDENIADILDMIVDIHPYINDYAKLAFIILFVLFIVLSAVEIFIIVIRKCCKVKHCCFRCIFHVFWNLICLLTIISFIFGGVFGISGIIGKEGTNAFSYIMSEENLMGDDYVLIGGDEAGEILNICLNGNGELSEHFDFLNQTDSEGSVQDIQDIYEQKETIKNYTEFYNELEFNEMVDLVSPSNDKDALINSHNSIIRGFNLIGNSTSEIFNFYEDYKSNIKNDDLFSAFNCSKFIFINIFLDFVRHNLDILLYSLGGELGEISKHLGGMIIAISAFNLMAVMLGLIIIVRGVSSSNNDNQETDTDDKKTSDKRKDVGTPDDNDVKTVNKLTD